MISAANSNVFFKTFKEALIAYSSGIGGILAGFIIARALTIKNWQKKS